MYSNTFNFSLKDKDGFSIGSIKIDDPKNQPLAWRDKSLMQFSGETCLPKDEALKIEKCTLECSFQSKLNRLLKNAE